MDINDTGYIEYDEFVAGILEEDKFDKGLLIDSLASLLDEDQNGMIKKLVF